MSKLTFLIGGARSGKSSYAEKLAAEHNGAVLYIATAQALDEEMQARITAHQQKRPADWQTLELSSNVGEHLLSHPPRADFILLDCVTLLVSNTVLQAAPDLDHPDEAAAIKLVETEITGLLEAIRSIPAHWVVVSNEVGQGLVPPYPVGRIYRDLLGWANQSIARVADEVYWLVAGIPVPIHQFRK
jgi:adenosylcobinamide kinase / adenosylcobinamide-phosphate guanylyltransferase